MWFLVNHLIVSDFVNIVSKNRRQRADRHLSKTVCGLYVRYIKGHVMSETKSAISCNYNPVSNWNTTVQYIKYRHESSSSISELQGNAIFRSVTTPSKMASENEFMHFHSKSSSALCSLELRNVERLSEHSISHFGMNNYFTYIMITAK